VLSGAADVVGLVCALHGSAHKKAPNVPAVKLPLSVRFSWRSGVAPCVILGTHRSIRRALALIDDTKWHEPSIGHPRSRPS
jgi:hypothetical protein